MHDHNAPLGVAAGIASAILLSLGLDPMLVQWVAIAAGGGLLLAAPSKRWVALFAFPVVVLLSAAMAQAITSIWFEDHKPTATLIGIGLGFLFHALVPVVVDHIPNVLGTLLQRFSGRTSRGDHE